MSLNTLRKRLEHDGGKPLERIKQQKLWSLQCALKNDYNSREIETESGYKCHALLTRKAIAADYDKEIISVPFDAGLHEGDTFEVLDNGTCYMIYLPDLVEIAYLKSEIIRCRYTIDINDRTYRLYFKGPTESSVDWSSKNEQYANDLNYSGLIYIKNNDDTKGFFKRFKKIKLAGHTWEIQATDYISVPGIIEIYIKEYYTDETEDLPQIIDQDAKMDNKGNIIKDPIQGETKVEPNAEIGYTIADAVYDKDIQWSIEGAAEIVETFKDGKIVKVKSAQSGEYTLTYGDYSLVVTVNAATPSIQGDVQVYPYSKHKYTIEGANGEFYLDTSLASIVESTQNSCEVEILTGKKGSFVLYFRELGLDTVYELPIKIKSL